MFSLPFLTQKKTPLTLIFLCSYMVRKLHAFVLGACCEESNDNLMFQEVLLPGTQYMQVLRVSHRTLDVLKISNFDYYLSFLESSDHLLTFSS